MALVAISHMARYLATQVSSFIRRMAVKSHLSRDVAISWLRLGMLNLRWQWILGCCHLQHTANSAFI